MDFLKSLMIAASGLKAQSGRVRVLAENLANSNSTAATPGGDPYRRKIATFQSHYDRELGASVVDLGRVAHDSSAFRESYDPGHPAANDKGYVKLSNVNSLIETVDMRQAQRSYEANLNVITATRTMITRTLDILRS